MYTEYLLVRLGFGISENLRRKDTTRLSGEKLIPSPRNADYIVGAYERRQRRTAETRGRSQSLLKTGSGQKRFSR